MSETGRSDDEGCGRDKEERCRSAAASKGNCYRLIKWAGLALGVPSHFAEVGSSHVVPDGAVLVTISMGGA